jgi:hypothetical protein
LKNDSKSTGWKGWSVRSYFDRLSTNGDIRCRRVRIEKPFEERVRFGKSIYDLERPFIWFDRLTTGFDKLSTNGDRCY